MKTKFQFQMQNVIFIFQTKSRCWNLKRDFLHLDLQHFRPYTSHNSTPLPSSTSDSVGVSEAPIPVSQRPALCIVAKSDHYKE